MSNQLREQLLREAVITEARHLRNRMDEYSNAMQFSMGIRPEALKAFAEATQAAARRVATAVDKLEGKA
jgi:hypothetical protein